jgi:biotin transport system substrate-specific component
MQLTNRYGLSIANGLGFSFLKDALLISTSALLMALIAPLSISLPFTPVPLALGPQLAILLGVLLGPKRGAMAVLGYLFQGVMGMPVFALGHSGLAVLLGARGGYLIGYVAAAYLVGYLVHTRKKTTNYSLFSSMAAANGIIFLFGAIQLSLFIGWKSAFILGVLPFLVGDFIKLIAVYRLVKNSDSSATKFS